MRLGFVVAALVACAAALPAPRAAAAPSSPLTDEDRKAFAWFDGIGLPSCGGKPYVRVRWVQGGAPKDARSREDVWELDGFLVAEKDGEMTVLDGDLWPRKVNRKPPSSWQGDVTTVDLAGVARAALGRLRAMREDPGAVEPMADLFRGIRLKFGDEGQTLALARHCAENGLEREAHDLLDAARALPPLPGASPGVPLERTAADQMAESVLWRILFDFADPSSSRTTLLARFRGWRTSFPNSPHAGRADDALRVLPGMVAEEASHPRPPDAEVEKLPPEARAREWVWRLRDHTGDVYMGRDGRVSIELGENAGPAQRLLAMGTAAAPALVEAIADERYTRAVLFIEDTVFRRQVVARVGDVARVVLEQISKESFWDAPKDEPSMFQHGAAAEVQERCRAWLASAPKGK